MTTSMPTGDGTVTDGPTRSAVDQEAAPATGLEPDTAADAAGEADVSATADVTLDEDRVTGAETGRAEPADDEQPSAETSSDAAGAPSDRTVLDGPALENQEMHRATDDLRSSEDKTAQARAIADELTSKTQPGPGGA